MDEETEVLDWEEDEEQANIPTQAPVDDADGVSLGSDSGDEAENVEPEPEPSSAPVPSSLDPPIQVQEETADSTTEPASPRDFSAKPNDSSPLNSPPQPQNRSQRSRPKPLSAAQMMAHGLPPKPVASAVPFLPSSHSSLTEATAMATRETGKGKAASSSSKTPAAKSTFPDESDPLPPYWEIRHPRSGGRQVYYYNTRTHESTWIHPSSQQSHSPTPSKGSLSFEDRHYRPGERRDVSPDDYERINRYISPEPNHRRSPSPYSKRRGRSISPGRGRDSGRGRPSQPSSLTETRHANRDRDTAVFSDKRVSPDRHWSPSRSKDFEDTRSRHPQRQRIQDHPDEGKARERDPHYESASSISRNSNQSRRDARVAREQDLPAHSSNHRHRSPPLTHEQPQHQRPIERERKRERATRFGTPPPQSGVTANDPEEWVPDEFKDTGRIAHTNRVEDPVADSERPFGPPSDPQQSSRRKRAPLPPQSARFREASRNKTPPPRDISLLPTQKQETGPPQPPFRPQLPSLTIMTRDPPPHQKVTKFGAIKADESIPIVSSSPRQHMRTEGTEGDRGLNQNDGSNNADHGMRPGGGMYADRESVASEDGSSNAPPPKGPRAMGGRDDSSSTTSQRREFVPSPARTWKDEMFGSTRPGRGKNGRGRPPPPPAPPPHLSGGNNVPVAGRIGADGIPNGPARSIPAPAPKLSSANKIPVTNNRYAAESRQAHEEARSRSPPHSRNGEGHGMRMTSGPMTYERDEPPTRDREHAMPMSGYRSRNDRLPSPSYTSPPYRREPSPPPSREPSPRWEQDSVRGRSGRGTSLGKDDRPRDGPERVRRDDRREPQVNGYSRRPPSPLPPPPPHGLPPKPMLLPREEYPPPRQRARNGRSVSPVDQRDRGGRRRMSDVQFPPPRDLNDIGSLSTQSTKSSNIRRGPNARDVMDIDVDYGPVTRSDRDRQEYPERPPMEQRASLLSRLDMTPLDEKLDPTPPLRSRVQIPSKRDRGEMIREEGYMNANGGLDVDLDDGMGLKKRRRNAKTRRRAGGGRGGTPA